jgi:hypothetical protein
LSKPDTQPFCGPDLALKKQAISAALAPCGSHVKAMSALAPSSV